MGKTLAVILMLVMTCSPAHGEAERVRAARQSHSRSIAAMFAESGVAYPPAHVFIRVFKMERELELWARDGSHDKYVKVASYEICYLPGEPGPKRREGDMQVPEGIYRIVVWNPWSSYHLSMGLDYPNRSDRILGHPQKPGGDIYIHGSCVSIGCIPIMDGPISQLYLICLDSKETHKRAPVVHIFPCRMDSEECLAELSAISEKDETLKSFWADLAPIHAYFEKERELPAVSIDGQGRYRMKEATR